MRRVTLSIEIRGATALDVNDILTVTAQVQTIHALAYPAIYKPVPAGGLPPDDLLAALADAAQIVLVALMSGVVGYARIEVQVRPESAIKYARTQLYVHELGVREDMRKRGVGAALLDHVDGLARARGIRDVAIDVMERNSLADAFYVARGFEVRRRVLWRDAGQTGQSAAHVP